MTEKELKRLSRAELLELLLMQTRETEVLKMQLEEAKQELQNREIRIREAGNLADATLAINGVLESAQQAAEQYLENITRMEKEARQQCRQMLLDAAHEAEKIERRAAGRTRIVIFKSEKPRQAEPEFPRAAEPEKKASLQPLRQIAELARKPLQRIRRK